MDNKYTAPDFIKVVANVKESFAQSGGPGCTFAYSWQHIYGQPFGNTGYNCGDPVKHIDTPYAFNCWINDMG